MNSLTFCVTNLAMSSCLCETTSDATSMLLVQTSEFCIALMWRRCTRRLSSLISIEPTMIWRTLSRFPSCGYVRLWSLIDCTEWLEITLSGGIRARWVMISSAMRVPREVVERHDGDGIDVLDGGRNVNDRSRRTKLVEPHHANCQNCNDDRQADLRTSGLIADVH